MMHTLSFLLAAVSLVSAKPLEARFQSSFSGGDITFYEGGLTACGKTIDTNSDKTVAVSFNVFDNFPGAGANSNKNPICKTKVRATINGKTQELQVLDSCQGCKDADLDLTQAAWDAFGVARSVGRKSGLKWEFIGVGGSDDSSDDSSATTSTKKAAATTSTKKAEATKSTEKAEATTSTKKEETATKTSSSSSDEPTTPAIAVSGGAVDSSDDSSDSSDSSDTSSSTSSSSSATETSASDAGSSSDSTSSSGSSSDDSSDSGSSSDTTSDAGSDSSAADTATPSATEASTPAESSPAAVSGGSFDECNTAWTACNSKFKGTEEDLASYSCQTDYVNCVNAAMGKSERRRSLRRHIAHSRLESF